ncbi:MAG: hypothetical protein GF329_15845 [Candidatus Lokiarchaeota archaeon]|nr:hypothetical protein [Candidatus Lokiarchaeota archaeon]
MKDQGCLIDCIYCKYLHPELEKSSCPKCHGKTPYFQHARMMDNQSSSKEIFGDILKYSEKFTKKQSFEFWYKILKKIEIYGFDLKSTVIEYLKEIEEK